MFFMKREGGFTTPAAALAILVACSLAFVSTRIISVDTQSSQIQYVADAGALAADGVVAEFVTAAQVADSICVSLSLLGLTTYAASAVAAFIPGGQTASVEIAQIGAKVMRARDTFAETATKGLNAAQEALPALCAIRASQVIRENASSSGTPYIGTALACPLEGVPFNLPDGTQVKEAIKEIEAKTETIQEAALRQEEAQKKEDEAKRRAWLADCGSEGMCMFERAKKLSSIAPSRNPHYSSPDRWFFSIGLERAKAYYTARFAQEPGASASGSPEKIGESVARKRFYAYAKVQVAKGYIDRSASGAEVPHLVHIARNTEQIRSTSLYTEAIYPISLSEEGRFLHAYSGCPNYASGSPNGVASVQSIDSGQTQRCPECNFNATTLGRVPSASTSINNGFEYHYKALVDAANDYSEAVSQGEQAKQELTQARDTIGPLLTNAVKSLGGTRFEPQPPGRYGCICIVAAPDKETGVLPFVKESAKTPARLAISGASLAPDKAGEHGTVVSDIAQGLFGSGGVTSGIAKTVFGAWSSMLLAYTDGCENIKTGLRKTLGAIPLVGTSLSNSAVTTFENALGAASLQPPDLSTYKPVLVNTSYIADRDSNGIGSMLSQMKQASQVYGAAYVEDMDALIKGVVDLDIVTELLDEKGLQLAQIPLGELGLGPKDVTLYFPVYKDLKGRLEEAMG